jgi:predicted transcriptional regulator
VTAPAGVVRLDRARARAITRRLRGAVDLALDVLVEAYMGQVWEPLGHASWAAYVEAEVPGLSVIGKGLPLEQRRDAVAELRGRGLSLRAVAEVLGVAPSTVKGDADARGVELAQVLGLDGRRSTTARSSSTSRRRGPVKTDRTVALLLDAGPDGLTVREVARALRCEQHKAAATLTRLHDAGRIGYRAPERRGLFGRYVAGRI